MFCLIQWPNFLLICSQAAKQTLPTRRRQQAAEETAPTSLTIKQTRELKFLKGKLKCSKGHLPWCWVASDGTHRVITIPQVSLWAQMIVRNVPTYPGHTTTNLLPRPTELPRLNIPLQFGRLIISQNESRSRRRPFPLPRFTFTFCHTSILERHPPLKPSMYLNLK